MTYEQFKMIDHPRRQAPELTMGNTTAPIAYPHCHINGTKIDDLYSPLADVVSSLRETQRLLKLAAPNERDYYMIFGEFNRAVSQHTARLQWLDRLIKNLDAEREAIVDQMDEEPQTATTDTELELRKGPQIQ